MGFKELKMLFLTTEFNIVLLASSNQGGWDMFTDIWGRRQKKACTWDSDGKI
jgi:hypothetical protein